jgi:hypothetical protein
VTIIIEGWQARDGSDAHAQGDGRRHAGWGAERIDEVR